MNGLSVDIVWRCVVAGLDGMTRRQGDKETM